MLWALVLLFSLGSLPIFLDLFLGFTLQLSGLCKFACPRYVFLLDSPNFALSFSLLWAIPPNDLFRNYIFIFCPGSFKIFLA